MSPQMQVGVTWPWVHSVNDGSNGNPANNIGINFFTNKVAQANTDSMFFYHPPKNQFCGKKSIIPGPRKTVRETPRAKKKSIKNQ